MSEARNYLKIMVMPLVWLLWKIRQAFTRFSNLEPKNICVLYLSGMGDILCDSFFFRELRARYPQAVLTACFPAPFCDLQRNYFQFDKYIAHQDYWTTLKELWKLNCDLIIIPGWLTRNSILAILSNARAIIGYVNDLSFTNRYLNSFTLEAAGIRVNRFRQDMRLCHLAQRPAAISAALGIPHLEVTSLSIPRLKEARNYAVFHAGARFPGRRWKEDNFCKVAEWLLQSAYVDTVYLIGDEADKAINLRIRAFSKSKAIIDKAGGMSLVESFELISAARFFLGNDSGPMHISALAGVPTLGLLGPNFPHISGPLGTQSRWIFHEFPCSGCNQRTCAYGYRCINAITVEETLQAIKQMTGIS